MASETAATAIIPHEPIREQIGSEVRLQSRFYQSPYSHFNSVDVSQTDYAYWDRARRGKVTGLEMAGLFLAPLSDKKAQWVLGMYPRWETGRAKADRLVNDWWLRNHPSVVRAYKEAGALGDCYLVVNGDLSVTVVPPNMVSRLTDPDDYSKHIGYVVRQNIPYLGDIGNPRTDVALDMSRQIVEDYYFASERWHVVRVEGGATLKATRYKNIVGRIPVIHIANRTGADEMFGRADGEPLLNLLIRYNDVLEQALKGNIRQGRPTPVIEGLGSAEQVDEFWTRFGRRETHHNADTGEDETIYVIDFDPDVLITLGGDGAFKYASPQPFSTDTLNLLQILFYLIVQNSQIPEFVWGGAIGSSKASAAAQLEPFIKWVVKQRDEAMSWIQELNDLVVAYLSVYEGGLRNLSPKPMWRPIASADGRLTLDTIIWAWTKQLIGDARARWMLGLDDDATIEDAKRLATSQPKPDTNGNGNGATPASGGGDQQNFKYENPTQPTERQMVVANGNGNHRYGYVDGMSTDEMLRTDELLRQRELDNEAK